jgi:uncharacterized protein (TIGR02996 family)
MNQEAAFLSDLIEDPADDVVRLVYSDWLEEQGDPVSLEKAEFLRLTARPRGGAVAARLQVLAAGLDPDWLAPVSRLAVENCPVERANARRSFLARLFFRKPCTRRWETLGPTDEPAVRHCDDCRQNVYYCETILDARNHAAFGNCVAVDIGILRREGDLKGAEIWMGEPSPVDLVGMLEPVAEFEPDPVSLERERRRHEKLGGG